MSNPDRILALIADRYRRENEKDALERKVTAAVERFPGERNEHLAQRLGITVNQFTYVKRRLSVDRMLAERGFSFYKTSVERRRERAEKFYQRLMGMYLKKTAPHA